MTYRLGRAESGQENNAWPPTVLPLLPNIRIPRPERLFLWGQIGCHF